MSVHRSVGRLRLWAKRSRRLRWAKRRIAGDITFVKYEDLVGLSREFAGELGGHDCVVAIPRTGLVVGAVVANRLGVPLFTPETLPQNKYQNVLLIDDGCTRRHGTMERVAVQVKPKSKAAVFATVEGRKCLDNYMFLVLGEPVLYEWDLFQINLPTVDERKGFDLDGVLCHDPPCRVTSADYALNAKPYLIPNFKIGFIITGRSELLKEPTVAWLKRQGIEYGELIFTQDKGAVLLEKVPSIYYESDYETALILAKRTHIPIVAVDKMELLYQ